MKRKIDIPLLNSILSYDPNSGDLVWKNRHDMPKQWTTRYAGKAAGTVMRGRGPTYRTIRINGLSYYSHVLAFVLMTGREPVSVVDHIDGDGLNNKWENLREATYSENIANSKLRKDSSSGLKGAQFDRSRGKWQANITVNRKLHCLGRFETAEEAHAAYVRAAKEKFGNFARAS